MTLVTYEWDAPVGSLLGHLRPDQLLLDARPADTAATALERLRKLSPMPGTLVFHINLSQSEHWPERREAFVDAAASDGWRIVNGKTTNCTKRWVQRLCRGARLPQVAIDDAVTADTRCILKTDLNYGGRPERDLSPTVRRYKGISTPSATIECASDYRVGSFGDLVPAALSDPGLVLERFVANAEGRYVRTYLAGDAMVVSEAVNPRDVKKMEPGLWRWNTMTKRGVVAQDVASCARSQTSLLAETAGVDFGTLDFVVDEAGVHYAVDLNLCPGWGAESQPDMLTHLAGGLSALERRCLDGASID